MTNLIISDLSNLFILQNFKIINKYIQIIFESLFISILMSLLTIWALFSEDIRLSSTNKSSDFIFVVIISIAFILFLFEIILNCFYKENYFNFQLLLNLKYQRNYLNIMKKILLIGSFYFWLDLIATFSLIFEV